MRDTHSIFFPRWSWPTNKSDDADKKSSGDALVAAQPKKKTSHEVLLLTKKGDGFRIFAASVPLVKGKKIAKRHIGKLASGDILVDVSYAPTWDIPETKEERRARLEAERLGLNTIPEEDEEEEDEGEEED